jgi:hypothetical protein
MITPDSLSGIAWIAELTDGHFSVALLDHKGKPALAFGPFPSITAAREWLAQRLGEVTYERQPAWAVERNKPREFEDHAMTLVVRRCFVSVLWGGGSSRMSFRPLPPLRGGNWGSRCEPIGGSV